MDFGIILLVLAIGFGHGNTKEQHKQPSHMHHDHKTADGQHDPHYDHEAILGSKKEEEEFDELTPEESKRRLGLLATKMDTNKDGFVSKDELKNWILRSFQKLDEEEAKEQMTEHDENGDGKITWKEYIHKQYDYLPEDLENPKKRHLEDMEEFKKTKKNIEDDQVKFKAADRNGDGILNLQEYIAFEFPYEHPHMHEIELTRAMEEYDKNKDGIITLEEFKVEGDGSDPNWEEEEKERFEKYDKDHDQKLNRAEMMPWILPDNAETAKDEADHLFSEADDDKDKKLSLKEIVDHHEEFVGSQATNYGEFGHEEL